MKPPLVGITTVRVDIGGGRVRDGLTQDYATAIAVAGAIPILIPLSILETSPDGSLLRSLFSTLDGIVLPGGGDVLPSRYGAAMDETIRGVSEIRDAVEIELSQMAYEHNVPMLGICRGHQVMNVAMGGTLHKDVVRMQNNTSRIRHDADHETQRGLLMHTVDIEPGTWLEQLVGKTHLSVNSLHHQAVDRPADCMVISAWSEDGVVEGIEAPDHRFFVGVQWHPEAIANMPEMQSLFKQFVSVCNRYSTAA